MSLKTKVTLMKQNIRKLHNPQESNWGSASLEIIIEEIHTITIF
jgi:hypothetical protein